MLHLQVYKNVLKYSNTVLVLGYIKQLNDCDELREGNFLFWQLLAPGCQKPLVFIHMQKKERKNYFEVPVVRKPGNAEIPVEDYCRPSSDRAAAFGSKCYSK